MTAHFFCRCGEPSLIVDIFVIPRAVDRNPPMAVHGLEALCGPCLFDALTALGTDRDVSA